MGIFRAKSFRPKIRLRFVCVFCFFIYAVSRLRCTDSLKLQMWSNHSALGNNRQVECRLHGHTAARVLNVCLLETLNVTHPGACLFHVSLACIHACCSRF